MAGDREESESGQVPTRFIKFMADQERQIFELKAMVRSLAVQQAAHPPPQNPQPTTSFVHTNPDLQEVTSQRPELKEGEEPDGLVSRKEMKEAMQQMQEISKLKQAGVTSPYPAWMDKVPYPPKFQQPNLQHYNGQTSPRQHLCHFKALTGNLVGNDALLIRLFVSTLKGTAFL